jgi:hypothetical protein
LQRFQDWNGAEALFCRRETSHVKIENEYHGVWTAGTVELLGQRPAAAAHREFTPTQLGSKEYFDASFLGVVLSEVLPEAGDGEEFPLSAALESLDTKLAKIGLTPAGDFMWQERVRVRWVESSCRLYSGLPDTFAAIVVGDGTFEVIFISDAGEGNWIATGFADELDTRMMRKGPNGLPLAHPRVQLQTMDEPLRKIFTAHQAALRKSKAPLRAAPRTSNECVEALDRFLTSALSHERAAS